MTYRAESLVRKWQTDCQPMADPTDLEELEKRIVKFGERLMAEANEGRKPGHFAEELITQTKTEQT